MESSTGAEARQWPASALPGFHDSRGAFRAQRAGQRDSRIALRETLGVRSAGACDGQSLPEYLEDEKGELFKQFRAYLQGDHAAVGAQSGMSEGTAPRRRPPDAATRHMVSFCLRKSCVRRLPRAGWMQSCNT